MLTAASPRIILLIGLPGSGKSTWAARRSIVPLSSDLMRLLLSGNEENQSIHKQVFQAIRYLLRQRIRLGCKETYVDATHLTPWERKPYADIARRYGCRLEAVWFDIPAETCKRRNRRRGRVVPDEVLDAMAGRFVRPSRSEGFTRIRIVTPAGQRIERPKKRREQRAYADGE
jgi:predicted kinase